MTAATDTTLPRLTCHRAGTVLAWAVPDGWQAISSAAVGGGLVRTRWVVNARVDAAFARTDLEAWAAEVAAGAGLQGSGCALLTAADVSQVAHAHRAGVSAWATVGVTRPTWPHDPRAAAHPGAVPSCHIGRPGDGCDTPERHDGSGPPAPGTVNIVVALPVALSPSALVQALGTVTEAKAQVLVSAGVPGTGTASDAVVVLCPAAGSDDTGELFAGVRSTWGRRIAHAVHDAVQDGLLSHPWSPAADEAGRVW